MNGKINVLGIEIDNYTAKETMKKSIEYLTTEPVNMIEVATVDVLMDTNTELMLKEQMKDFDLVLAGDRTVLEAAEVSERKRLQETDDRLYLQMFFRYLHKNHKRIYLLVESEEEGRRVYEYLEHRYGSIQVCGMAKVSAQDRADDMLVNAINGAEVDCVLSLLSSPLREDFAVKNKNLFNVRLFLCLGKTMIQSVFDESIVQKRDRKAKDKKIIRNIFWLLCTDSKNAFYSQKSEEINKKL